MTLRLGAAVLAMLPAVVIALTYGTDASFRGPESVSAALVILLLVFPVIGALALKTADVAPVRRLHSSAAERRRKVIVQRRWQVLGIAVTVFAGATILLSWKGTLLRQLQATSASTLLAAVVVVVLVATRRGLRRFVAFSGIRHVSTYPPLWIGVATGMAIALFLAADYAPYRAAVGVPADLSDTLRSIAFGLCVPMVAAVVVGLIVGIERRHKNRGLVAPHASLVVHNPESPLTAEELEEWVASDDPIVTRKDDLLGHSMITDRIAARLLQERPASQAVIGGLGCGKTSARYLLEESLSLSSSSSNVEVVAVQLWPYDNPRAAVEGVIGALIEAMSTRVNLFRLKGVPAAYADAIASAGGVFSVLAHFKQPRTSPFDRLGLLNDVALATGIHYVLWVEDLERFSSGAPDSGSESDTELQRLAPIRALLHGLDELHAVTVITATTSLHQRLDLEKIARYVEPLPELDSIRARRILSAFRNQWMDVPIVDPTPPSVRQELGWDRELDPIWKALVGNRLATLSDAVIHLCRTPRVLKQSLRRCKELWEHLAGEIDLDAALAMTVVREATPEAFSIVAEFMEPIRSPPFEADKSAAKPIDQLRAALEATDLEPRTIAAIMMIVQATTDKSLLQGFAQADHADYWQRFLAMPEIAPSASDQEALRGIASGDDSTLLNMLLDESRYRSFETFASELSSTRIVDLLVPLVRILSTETWPLDEHPPGLIPLWRTYLARHRNGTLPTPRLAAAIEQTYEIAVPTSLRLAAEIEHWLVVPSRQVPTLLDGRQIAKAKSKLRNLVLESYAGEPLRLANALRDTPRYTLLWLVWGIERVRASDMNDTPFEDWNRLAETVLSAAALVPTAILPQLAPFLVEETGDLRARQHIFSHRRCELLFGEPAKIFAVFEKAPEQLVDDEEIRVVRQAGEFYDLASAVGSFPAERAKAFARISNMLDDSPALDTAVSNALATIALDQSMKTEDRARAISLLRKGGKAASVRESLLSEWLSPPFDRELGNRISTLFMDDPDSLDGLCAALAKTNVPKPDETERSTAIEQALAAVHHQLLERASDVGVVRAQHYLGILRRFRAVETLKPIVEKIESLITD